MILTNLSAVSLPKELVDYIDENFPHLGFKSRRETIILAVRFVLKNRITRDQAINYTDIVLAVKDLEEKFESLEKQVLELQEKAQNP